jgi:hypothetical protein
MYCSAHPGVAIPIMPPRIPAGALAILAFFNDLQIGSAVLHLCCLAHGLIQQPVGRVDATFGENL